MRPTPVTELIVELGEKPNTLSIQIATEKALEHVYRQAEMLDSQKPGETTLLVLKGTVPTLVVLVLWEGHNTNEVKKRIERYAFDEIKIERGENPDTLEIEMKTQKAQKWISREGPYFTTSDSWVAFLEEDEDEQTSINLEVCRCFDIDEVAEYLRYPDI